jgi:F420-non-reducing hydrogenase large subunit
MGRRLTIDPITRLEGHGRIEIVLDDTGEVDRAYLQTPDLRGFEKFCQGRAAEEMPRLIQKVCGVCPTAHHTASVKALDDLFQVDPPAAAKLIRELLYCAFVFEDHCLHFYYLGGPDFMVGSQTPRSQRNIFGVLQQIGSEHGKRLMATRSRVRGIHTLLGGSSLFPVYGLPGGVAKAVREEDREQIHTVALDAVEFARETLGLFTAVVLPNQEYSELMSDAIFSDPTYYMGMVDVYGKLSFCEGNLRVVDAAGNEAACFAPHDYRNHLVETVDAWSYAKPLYYKGPDTQAEASEDNKIIYRVGPLARLNVANGLATPLAQEESEKMFERLGGKPVHSLWAYHWARLIELLHAAERMVAISDDDALTSSHIRNLPGQLSTEGVGVCEAPRGTLIHHYWSDDQGVIRELNLLVATQNNIAAISHSITQAARKFIRAGEVSEGLLNRVEMAFRAYDPCLACAVHALDGGGGMAMNIYDSKRCLIKTIHR